MFILAPSIVNLLVSFCCDSNYLVSAERIVLNAGFFLSLVFEGTFFSLNFLGTGNCCRIGPLDAAKIFIWNGVSSIFFFVSSVERSSMPRVGLLRYGR